MTHFIWLIFLQLTTLIYSDENVSPHIKSIEMETYNTTIIRATIRIIERVNANISPTFFVFHATAFPNENRQITDLLNGIYPFKQKIQYGCYH